MRNSNKPEPIPYEQGRIPYDSEAKEAYMISLAEDLAMRQLQEGTASAQVITHYLKLGTQREKIEREILEKQKEMISAKTESIRSSQNTEELYAKAIEAMRLYGGSYNDPNVH